MSATKTFKSIFFFLVFFSLAAVNCFAVIIDFVAAKVNEEIITLSDVKQRVNDFARARKITSQEELRKLEIDTLKRMIEDKLLLERAKEIGVTVEEKDVDAAIKDIQQKNNIEEQQFEEMLERTGYTLDKYREEIKERILISKVTGMEIRSKIKVLEKDVKKYYKDHKDEFSTPEEVNARHILIAFKEGVSPEKIKQKSGEIYGRLKKGENFASLARLYSDDGTAADGGNLGYFRRGMMVAEFEEAAFSLKIDEVGRPVKTEFGYHIIQVTERKERQAVPFQEARSEIEGKLRQKKWKEKFKEIMDELKSRNYVEILHEEAAKVLSEKGKENESGKKRIEIDDEQEIAELIKKTILKWAKTTEGEDLKGYAWCYSRDFSSDKKNRKQWAKQQFELYKSNDNIQVTIRGLRVTKKKDIFIATFGQEFVSEQKHNLFTRRFYLRLEGNNLKIVREKWIKKKPNFRQFSEKALLTSRTRVLIVDSSS